MPPTVAQTLKDPKFYGLPLDQQEKVLATLDKGYAALPADQRQQVIELAKTRLGNTSSVPTTPSSGFGDIRPLTQRERFEMTYPVGVKGEGIGENIHNMAQNVGVGMFKTLAHPIDTITSAISSFIPGTSTPNPLQSVYQAFSTGRAGEEVPQMLGSAIVTAGALKGAGAAGSSAIDLLGNPFSPVDAEISGEKVPVLRGEAFPESKHGSTQIAVKQSGVGRSQFQQFADAQTEAIRRVIRNVARNTSQMTGPVSNDPGPALLDASKALEAQAKPMYQALDSARLTVPDQFNRVSKIMQAAIDRAKKLGVPVDQEIASNSRNIQTSSGIAPVKGQPFFVYQQVRSALLRAKRAALEANDGAMANSINEEIKHMNGQIDQALEGSRLHETWTEANRTWAQAKAVEEVSDAFFKTTKGTPTVFQSEELGKVPTRVQGPSLVQRLNELDREGTLRKAFNPQEEANLRKAADILDRAREDAGRDVSILPGHTYSAHSYLWRYILRLPFKPLVRAMTTSEGVRAITMAEKADTPVSIRASLIPLIIAMSNSNKPSGGK